MSPYGLTLYLFRGPLLLRVRNLKAYPESVVLYGVLPLKRALTILRGFLSPFNGPQEGMAYTLK